MDRFWDKVAIGEPWECWEWVAAKNNKGYGRFRLGEKMELAHRVVWELTNGPIPPGEGAHGTCVCHHCDNTACCNPAHLFLGTNADNVADCVAKGRTHKPKGTDNPATKLTDLDIHAIRLWIKKGHSQQKIADVFEVTQQAISDINTGKRWSHV